MSAVTLPAPTDAQAQPAAGTGGPSADQSAGFSELLSTLAAGSGGGAATTSEANAVPVPAVPVPGSPVLQIVDAVPVSSPATPGETPGRPEEAEADEASKEARQPLPAASVSPLSVLRQPLFIDAVSAPTAVRPVGTERPVRPRAGDSQSADLGEQQDKAEPSAWTMQQALAAVAAIAAPQPVVVVPGASAAQASKLSLENLPAQAAMSYPAVVGSGTPKAQPLAQLLSLEHRAADDSPIAKAIAPLAAPATSFPIDPQVLTAALGHAKQAAIIPQAGLAPTSLAPSGADLDLHQLDALVRDIAAVSGTTGRADFRLTADQLGPIDVRLHNSDAGMAVTIRTHDDQSHSAVAQAQQQLTDEMRANGLKVAATNVMLGGGGADRQRQDRQNAPAALPIEVAAAETEQSQSPDEPRPDGRYA